LRVLRLLVALRAVQLHVRIARAEELRAGVEAALVCCWCGGGYDCAESAEPVPKEEGGGKLWCVCGGGGRPGANMYMLVIVLCEEKPPAFYPPHTRHLH
jgi:hypothetical protein